MKNISLSFEKIFLIGFLLIMNVLGFAQNQVISDGKPCQGIPHITDSRDGQVYPTVKIGNQCWLNKNLNIGIRIDGNQNQAHNRRIEKYCYDNLESNCKVYGGLYQWNEMMQHMTTNGVTGICPNGWHIPTDDEWTVLMNYLGGEEVAGGKMKESRTYHWGSPNVGATNSSGFTALPGGYRYVGSSFCYLAGNAVYWSSSENSSTHAWGRPLYYDYEGVYRGFFDKNFGFSVRCLKDKLI